MTPKLEYQVFVFENLPWFEASMDGLGKWGWEVRHLERIPRPWWKLLGKDEWLLVLVRDGLPGRNPAILEEALEVIAQLAGIEGGEGKSGQIARRALLANAPDFEDFKDWIAERRPGLPRVAKPLEGR